jgi:hypothetical protein
MNILDAVGPPILYHSARLGLAENFLKPYTSISGRYDKLGNIDKKIQEYPELTFAEADGAIILPHMHYQSDATNYLYCILAHIFRTRNIKPIMLTCDNDMHMCFRKDYRRDDIGTCAHCHFDSKKLLEGFGLEPTYIHEYSNNGEYTDRVDEIISSGNMYKSVDVLSAANATTRAFSRIYKINKDSEIRRKFVKTAITLVDATNKLVNKYNVDAVIGHHPEYVYGGIPVRVAAERDISSITFGDGYYREERLMFGNMKNRSGLPEYASEEDLLRFVNSSLSKEEIETVESTMNSRKERVSDELNSNKGFDISIEDDKKVIGLFGNLLWDAALAGADYLFEDAITHVIKTIEYLKDRPDIYLIVKPHPSEATYHTEEKLGELIREDIKTVPTNVDILTPETDINPYELIELIDLGVVYNSTVGFEMAFEGIPTITAGDTPYKGLGFTLDPENVSQYQNMLDNIESNYMDEAMIKRAKRYAYFLFEERLIDLKFWHKSKKETYKIKHDDLIDNRRIDSLVNLILSDKKTITHSMIMRESHMET